MTSLRPTHVPHGLLTTPHGAAPKVALPWGYGLIAPLGRGTTIVCCPLTVDLTCCPLSVDPNNLKT